MFFALIHLIGELSNDVRGAKAKAGNRAFPAFPGDGFGVRPDYPPLFTHSEAFALASVYHKNPEGRTSSSLGIQMR